MIYPILFAGPSLWGNNHLAFKNGGVHIFASRITIIWGRQEWRSIVVWIYFVAQPQWISSLSGQGIMPHHTSRRVRSMILQGLIAYPFLFVNSSTFQWAMPFYWEWIIGLIKKRGKNITQKGSYIYCSRCRWDFLNACTLLRSHF